MLAVLKVCIRIPRTGGADSGSENTIIGELQFFSLRLCVCVSSTGHQQGSRE